jgi:hypothetical protein
MVGFFVLIGGVRVAGAAMLQTFVLNWVRKFYWLSGVGSGRDMVAGKMDRNLVIWRKCLLAGSLLAGGREFLLILWWVLIGKQLFAGGLCWFVPSYEYLRQVMPKNANLPYNAAKKTKKSKLLHVHAII